MADRIRYYRPSVREALEGPVKVAAARAGQTTLDFVSDALAAVSSPEMTIRIADSVDCSTGLAGINFIVLEEHFELDADGATIRVFDEIQLTGFSIDAEPTRRSRKTS